MTKNCIVLLTRTPDNIWLNFLNNFNNYDIYVIIDENKYDYYKLYKSVNTKIKFIQIDDNYSKLYGYHSAVWPTGSLPNKPMAWDKALFYFCKINPNSYDHIWLIEDDVFVLKESVIENIDKKYPSTDLLTPFNDINYDGNLSNWELWFTVVGNINLPWARSMTCACRLSNRVFDKIRSYVDHKHKLFFHEAMFNTIALQNNLTIETPIELNGIHYRTTWDLKNLDLNNVYHPVKDLTYQLDIKMDNLIYYDNLFNNVNYNNLDNFNSDPGLFLSRNLKFPIDFNICCYRENNDMKNWCDEGISWHWFSYGQYEDRKYKD